MKKALIVLALLMLLPASFAARIDTYGDYSDAKGSAIVGKKGYVHIDSTNSQPDVFACGTKDGRIDRYGMNLRTDAQYSAAAEWLRNLNTALFSVFDHYGCIRTK